MRVVVALLMLLISGCNQTATQGPLLAHEGTGLDENGFPLLFALKLANHGDAAATIDDMRFQVTYRTALIR